jgi:hypothetical protein
VLDWHARGLYVYHTLVETARRSQQGVLAYLESRGLTHRSFFAANQVVIFNGDLPAVMALAGRVEVARLRSAVTAYIVSPGLIPVGPPAPTAITSWGLVDSGAVQFWNAFNNQGEGVVVANIDTGVQWNHPALINQFKCPGDPSNPACWRDPANVCDTAGACDNNGHGTAVMGVMVAKDDPTLQYISGMAPDAQWIACKGCESLGCSEASLNACADWMLAPAGNPDNRPQVVNNSWGGGGANNWFMANVQAWWAAGIFPLFAVGGSGPSCGSLGSPSDYQESFASAAHDINRVIAPFSPSGPSAFGSDPYTKPNLSAPGVNICTTVPGNGWQCYSGSSFSTPHSAGAVALLWSCDPSLRGEVDATFQLLQNNADAPPPDPRSCGTPPNGGNYTYGYGYLNVLAAGNQVCSVGTLAGIIKTGSGDPIAGADITAVTVNPPIITHTTTSGADGSYSLSLPEGAYNVSVRKYSFALQTADNVVVLDGQTTTQDFILSPAEVVILTGAVVDGSGHGYPLYSSLAITSPGFNTQIFINPFTGAYSIQLYQDTDYDITAAAVPAGYLQTNRVGLVFNSDTATQDFALLIDLNTCSAPGYYLVNNLAQNFERASPLDLPQPGQSFPNLVCVPIPGGLVAGLVSDSATGSPMNGVAVVGDTGAATFSLPTPLDPNLPDGFYWLFQPTPPVEHDFTATGPAGYFPLTLNVSVTADAVTRQDFALVKILHFWLPAIGKQ